MPGVTPFKGNWFVSRTQILLIVSCIPPITTVLQLVSHHCERGLLINNLYGCTVPTWIRGEMQRMPSNSIVIRLCTTNLAQSL